MSDERDLRSQKALDAFWDGFGGDDPGRPSDPDLDPILAEAIRRIHDLDAQPAEDPAFGPRLWEDMMSGVAQAGTLPLYPRSLGTNGRSQSSSLSRSIGTQPLSRRHWSTVVAAIAAVLLLVGLGIGYVAFGPGWPGDDDNRTTIPAAVVPTPSPAPYTEESLLEMMIPAELLPGGEAIMGGLNHISWSAGDTATWNASRGANNPGLRFEYLLEGSYTVEVDGPAQLLRAGSGAPEAVPANAEVALGPGDALAFANDVGATYKKPEGTEVELLFWILFDASKGAYSTDPIPPAWIITDLDLQTEGLSALGGPAMLRLRRVELAEEADYPPTASGAMQFSVGLTAESAAGTPVPAPVFARSNDGSIHNYARRATVVVLTLEPAEDTRTPPPWRR
jgi:hypothetical protein